MVRQHLSMGIRKGNHERVPGQLGLEANTSPRVLTKSICGFCHKCHICSRLQCKHLETSNIFDLYSAALQPVDSSLAISVPRSISLAYGFNEVPKHHDRKI